MADPETPASLSATWRRRAEALLTEAEADRARSSVGLAQPKEWEARTLLACADERDIDIASSTPTDAPKGVRGGLVLNAYGRACYHAGLKDRAEREAAQPQTTLQDAALTVPPSAPPSTKDELFARLQNYLGNGGFWNPKMMDHEKVGQLLINIRDYLAAVPPSAWQPIRPYADAFMGAIGRAIHDAVVAADAKLTPEQREKVRKFDEILRLVDGGMEPTEAARQMFDAAAVGTPPGSLSEKFCKDDEHVFGPCKTCGMPYLASRLEPPTADDVKWAREVIENQKSGTPAGVQEKP